MIVVGIDPGSRKCGAGVVCREGTRFRYMDSIVIIPPKKAELPERLVYLHQELATFLDKHTPTHAVVEDVFYHRNARSALILGQARGVALLACGQQQLEIHEVPPAQVKRNVAGRGNATKEEVRRCVEIILGQRFGGLDDETDALALALYLAQSAGLRAAIQAAEEAR